MDMSLAPGLSARGVHPATKQLQDSSNITTVNIQSSFVAPKASDSGLPSTSQAGGFLPSQAGGFIPVSQALSQGQFTQAGIEDAIIRGSDTKKESPPMDLDVCDMEFNPPLASTQMTPRTPANNHRHSRTVNSFRTPHCAQNQDSPKQSMPNAFHRLMPGSASKSPRFVRNTPDQNISKPNMENAFHRLMPPSKKNGSASATVTPSRKLSQIAGRAQQDFPQNKDSKGSNPFYKFVSIPDQKSTPQKASIHDQKVSITDHKSTPQKASTSNQKISIPYHKSTAEKVSIPHQKESIFDQICTPQKRSIPKQKRSFSNLLSSPQEVLREKREVVVVSPPLFDSEAGDCEPIDLDPVDIPVENIQAWNGKYTHRKEIEKEEVKLDDALVEIIRVESENIERRKSEKEDESDDITLHRKSLFENAVSDTEHIQKKNTKIKKCEKKTQPTQVVKKTRNRLSRSFRRNSNVSLLDDESMCDKSDDIFLNDSKVEERSMGEDISAVQDKSWGEEGDEEEELKTKRGGRSKRRRVVSRGSGSGKSKLWKKPKGVVDDDNDEQDQDGHDKQVDIFDTILCYK